MTKITALPVAPRASRPGQRTLLHRKFSDADGKQRCDLPGQLLRADSHFSKHRTDCP